jgi:hypothetical protein
MDYSLFNDSFTPQGIDRDTNNCGNTQACMRAGSEGKREHKYTNL